MHENVSLRYTNMFNHHEEISVMDAIEVYRNFLHTLDRKISTGPYKVDYICTYLGVSRSALYKKRKNQSFSIAEAEKLAQLFEAVKA